MDLGITLKTNAKVLNETNLPLIMFSKHLQSLIPTLGSLVNIIPFLFGICLNKVSNDSI